jgi:hypothetical protein
MGAGDDARAGRFTEGWKAVRSVTSGSLTEQVVPLGFSRP